MTEKEWELIVWFRFRTDEITAEAVAHAVETNPTMAVMGKHPLGYELRPVGTWVLVDEAGEVVES